MRVPLSIALICAVATSFFHHAHNAEFLHEYPNLPAWLSPLAVYSAWIVATAIGATGYWLLRRGQRLAGVVLLALYGFYGLDTLLHYARAPVSAHTLAMNLSIWLEAAAALVLLAVLFRPFFSSGRRGP
jgi:hypothetical protein